MTLQDPNTPVEWINVALERGADADALGTARPNSTGSIYMAGYVIECSLKAYLRSLNRPFPKGGPAGHNLRGLWEAAGFRLADVRDPQGAKSFFIERWSTDLRYERHGKGSKLPWDTETLVRSARQLAGWIQGKIKPGRRSR